MAWKTAREKWLPYSRVWNVRKVTHTYECLLSILSTLTHSGTHQVWLRPSCRRRTSIWHSCAYPTRIARSLSAALLASCEYLYSYLKLYYSYSFKQSTYLVTKTFMNIFSVICLKLFEEGCRLYGRPASAAMPGGKNYQITHLPEMFPRHWSSARGCPLNWLCTKSDYFLRVLLT